jgi:hypothetical protein
MPHWVVAKQSGLADPSLTAQNQDLAVAGPRGSHQVDLGLALVLDTPLEVIDAMLAKYPAFGNRYALFAAAFSQFPS